jgi:hypothetical protein
VKKRDHLTLLSGVGLGAGLMYLLDPQGGGRRRAVARDKAVSGLKKGGQALRKTSIDVGNRTRGLVAQASSRLRKDGMDDPIHESADGVSALQGEGSNGSRFSLKSVPPRAAALGVGALAGTVGLGLLASKARSGNLGDLARPLRESRWVRDRSSAQLEW